jgi:apolipoprotein D and lipocalin family protein
MCRALYLAALAALLVLAPLLVGGCGSEPLDVAANVDLQKFQGKWYEIARLPRTTQADCYSTTAFYSAGSGGALQLVHQCNVGSQDGPLHTVAMSASVPDQSVPAKLAVDVGGYSGDYWILDVGPNYEYALVGHPSRLYLWLLSRTPVLDSASTQTLVAKAQELHFETSQLVYTPQATQGERVSSPGPVGDVPPAVSTGCAVGSMGSLGVRGPWLVAWVLVLGAVLARRALRAAEPGLTERLDRESLGVRQAVERNAAAR